MYLRRKADAFLESWKSNPNRLPLIVKGARQVGKTETVKRFAESHYGNVIYINFVNEPQYAAITGNGYSAGEIIRYITLLDPSKRFVPGDTVIIFDEIQEYPDIATSLKFFKTDGRFDVICSGSLLGLHYKKIHSNSVGYKTDYEMLSMDFEEFLWAMGYSGSVAEELLANMCTKQPFHEALYHRFHDLFLDYCVLGGMPAVVKEYVQSQTFTGSLALQRQLLLDYEEDIRKYSEGLDQARIISVYRSVPSQLGKENKKFQYSSVKKGGRAKDYAGCIEWLRDAGVVNVCRCMNFPELPVKGNIDDSKFKLYYADTGLLVAALDDEAQLDLRANRNLGTYKGALYENLVGEALRKQDLPLCYYKKEDSTLEEDFFVRTAASLIPLEVKAGNTKSKSLTTLIRSDHYPDIRCGIKLASANVGYDGNIYTFPLFCTFLLKRFLHELQ